ncbi:hypothetical protein LTS16_000277 [Friedmanniomyces endolithicus]|uniref:Uncharacterized protein n=1 Tax=Friedmanniomyces endolithicus TaxID=329885 RepID=A0A4U0V1G6_9PEZI|nr:hypothetical protein LTS09_008461 [Friedmanniomyces endolithicus]KAK0281149.1 hypothetical protein LTR35_007523 [Friedmanniomyces endolithicus]KAK0295111.1 hypothetical protein LTS00_006167 [Friedmanniomyces endolithicus]KAK0313836.1 hypothetical protein LTR01_002093 [Friedmanniomyces endolithicus]KAK0831410.1 hypothetical protein LTR73_002792 [Friedmanniomyces endolithicus]
MTDSPAYRLPTDPKEQPILDRILTIRDHLSILKLDRSTYVKSQDVMTYYNQLIEEVEKLNVIRETKRDEQNRVDTVLDDCFQLISLFFMTIGRNQEAPAVYSAISTVKRLLDHLKEAGFYSPKDLESISHHIEQWQQAVERGRDEHSLQLLTLLDARIEVCRHILVELRDNLSKLSPEMMETYERLVSILRSLSALNTRSKFPVKEVNDFEQQLLEIQSQLHGSRDSHEGKSAEQVYAERLQQLSLHESTDGPTVVHGLLARCLLWVEIIQAKKGKIDDRFHDTYDKLLKIRNTLEQMNLTQAWSLRETDLYSYQRQLDRIDEGRVHGNFLDPEGRPADLHAQRTLLYLLRKSYACIYQYIVSSEPVSEALLPIYNQLLTLKRCLVEVQRSGGVDSPRELYPYSMKLNSIDNMKKDGKFMVGNDIPEGQASVTALLAECFDIAYELREQSQQEEEEETAAPGGVEATNGVEVAG